MKRLIVLLLLAVLPLQISWAAVSFHCPQGSDEGVGAAAASASLHAEHAHEHDGDNGDDGHGAGTGLDCSVLHLVALEPTSARAQALARAGATAHGGACPGYESHVPEGLERPNWGLAA